MYLKITCFENHNSIRINDRIETVGDRENGAITELVPDRNLYQMVRTKWINNKNNEYNKNQFSLAYYVILLVDIGSGFVNDEDAIAPKNGPSQTNQLTLTHRKIRSAFRHHHRIEKFIPCRLL